MVTRRHKRLVHSSLDVLLFCERLIGLERVKRAREEVGIAGELESTSACLRLREKGRI